VEPFSSGVFFKFTNKYAMPSGSSKEIKIRFYTTPKHNFSTFQNLDWILEEWLKRM